MKTKWKNILIFPLICLALSLTWNRVSAGVWEVERAVVCVIQVHVDTGNSYEWVNLQGLQNVCQTQRWSFCSARRCAPLVHTGGEQ